MSIGALAKRFGLKEDLDFKIELGKVYVHKEDEFGRGYWLFFTHKIAYHGDMMELLRDIKQEIEEG